MMLHGFHNAFQYVFGAGIAQTVQHLDDAAFGEKRLVFVHGFGNTIGIEQAVFARRKLGMAVFIGTAASEFTTKGGQWAPLA